MGLKEFSKKIGEGKIVKSRSGKSIFKLETYSNNPILKPQDLGLVWRKNNRIMTGAVFNSGAEIFKDRIIIAPRCHKNYERRSYFDKELDMNKHYMEHYISEVWLLESHDGIHFRHLDRKMIRGDGSGHKDFFHGIEDIRIVKFDNQYFLIGCGKIKPPFKGKDADRIAIYTTEDFKDIQYSGVVKWFDSRNCIIFPEEVSGSSYILLRFHPNIHLGRLNGGKKQILEPSKYEKEWLEIFRNKDKNILLSAGRLPHEREKIGPGTQLVKTERGWLMIYHAVGEIKKELCRAYGLETAMTRSYSICAAVLDLDDPSKVLCRTENPIYIPNKPWELKGNDDYPVDVPSVIFPVGVVLLKDRLFIYCGAGDKYVVLLGCKLDFLLDYLFDKSPL